MVCGAGADNGTVLTLAYESSRIETEKDRCETIPAECRNSGISFLPAFGGAHQGEVGENVKSPNSDLDDRTFYRAPGSSSKMVISNHQSIHGDASMPLLLLSSQTDYVL